ncbi:DUF4249 domain-containing protein [Cloacibacterium sp.]|uniref:DUF4249 domain-containing protein n=1 Tax=Cloacibacterium sp. TaxID=1913682 RepID=UPI0039E285FC
MKKFKKYIIIALGIVLISCEKVIDVDLDTAPPKLVVDASIDWVKNTTGNQQKIKLSTSTGYYSTEFPSVSGATITISNSENTVFIFTENQGTGEYVCNNFVPSIGETYTLTINLNGETYTATDKMIAAPKIEDNILQNNEGGMAGDEVEITYYYQDNPAETNYYVFSNKNPHIAFPQYQAENDENNNGGFTPVFYSDKDLKQGDIVSIKLYGISKRYYDYFRKILNASGADTGPFATTPTSVFGNISNKTNSANTPFGYFRLSEVDMKNYTIQ